MKFLVYFRYRNIEKPVIKVIDDKKQVTIIFIIFSDGEHLTLHQEKNGSILRTYWGKNKPKSTWDGQTVINAKICGYKDPEKHRYYYIHEPLHKISNTQGYHLVGRRIDISQAPEGKEKYKKMKKIIIDIPREKGMVNFYLSTVDNPYVSEIDPSFKISLGEIFINFKN